MRATLASWHGLWRELGAARGDEALFRRLVAAYSEPHRHYHTLQHLRECFERLDEVRLLAQRPAQVELALWFHDAVYDAQRQDNEERSAEWARASVLEAGLAEALAQRLHLLVMATKDHRAEDPDARLLVDIDLAILGAPARRFDESSRQVRAEYAHVPEEEFRAGRRRILQDFLARPQLFATDAMRRKFDQQARRNLSRAVAQLTSSAASR